VAKPLASLTQKIQKYEWAKEQEEAFQTLKDNLCCVLIKRGKVENAIAEMLRSLDQLMERKEDGGMKVIWVPLIDDVRTLMMVKAHASRLYTNEIVTRHGVHVSLISARGGKIYFAALVDIAEGIENTAKTCVRLIILKRMDKCRSHVLWVKIGGIRSIGPELVQETTNKVILIKEKLKAARDCQKSYVGNMRKHLELKLVIK
ncbi:hypothetical protein Tco_0044413, partial [Tanacetum coccineum]